tara:strand:- start:14 stop:322 length:309 start_codon:yes stop_codon:yes gene_type:complete
MMNTKNPQAKAINQKRGPTTGNAGTMSKRDDFMATKSTSGSEKSALADMVISALETRGRGMKPYIDPAVEGLHANTNVGPKSNSTANGSKLPSKYKKPITKG